MSENDVARKQLDIVFRAVLERLPGTQSALAEQMRIDGSYLSEIRHGRNRPSLKLARQLVGVLENRRARAERDRERLQRAIAAVEESDLELELTERS